MKTSRCLREKTSLGLVVAALVLWAFSIIGLIVVNNAWDLDESRIWCDTQVPASVQNLTEVFADFETSCLASIAYWQGGQTYVSEIAVDCSEGLEAAEITEHPEFCTKRGSTGLRKLFKQAEYEKFASESTQQYRTTVSGLIFNTFIATLTTAVVADIIGQPWSTHRCMKERSRAGIYMQEAVAASTSILLMTLTFLSFMALFATTLNFWKVGPSPHFLMKANVERILPYYKNFRLLCLAQLSLSLDDGSSMHRALKVDCRNGLRTAEETHTISVSLQHPFQTSNITLVRQAELEWTRFDHDMDDHPVPPLAKHQIFVVMLVALGRLILRLVALEQVPKWLDSMCSWWAARRTISPEHVGLIDEI